MSRWLRSPVACLAVAAFALFASTAARTITWWDGAHYPFLAATLSISNPPGSLILTVLGWLFTRVRFVPLAFQLHLLACGFGVATVVLMARLVASVRPPSQASDDTFARSLAIAFTGAWLATSFDFWTYANQFTPYGLSALCTASILTAFVAWWRRAERRDDLLGLALLGLSFGLDISVHRTNVLLIPAAGVGVLLRRPGLLRRPWLLLAPVSGFAAGAATQFGYLVLAARHPVMQTWPMATAADLWSFVRLEPLGGGFLVDLWPRRASFVHVQLMDWLRFLWRNLGTSDATRVFLALLALAGWAEGFRSRPRLTLALTGFFLAAGLGAVLYFNRPADYFRSLDRHYLASLVALSLFVGLGVRAIAVRLGADRGRLRAALGVLVLTAFVGSSIAVNFRLCDRSRTRYAERYGRDLLEPLPPGAVLVTSGDNDSFPLWYLQSVEHVRTDVLVVNLPSLPLDDTKRDLVRFHPAYRTFETASADLPALLALSRTGPPVHLVTGIPIPQEVRAHRSTRLEGLSERYLPDTTGADDLGPLQRFVTERLPHAGLADRGQIMEPEIQLMLLNYLYPAFQLSSARARRGDLQGALAVATQANSLVDWDRLGPDARAQRKGFEGWLASLRAEILQPKPTTASSP